jgi:hypothetical protein
MGALTCEQYRMAASLLAEQAGEWAGLPMAFDGEAGGLVVHPSYPWAKVFERDDRAGLPEDFELVNQWYSERLRSTVHIWKEGGKRYHAVLPHDHHADMLLRTLGAASAWSIETEVRAMQKLRSHVTEHAYKCYVLTGSFLETSKRSGVRYLFRKLRPTVALRDTPNGQVRMLATLCMHPVAYYQDSWAGAMCPTDDTLAHLLLMRADEKLYWRRCNQHPPCRPESGI